MDFLGSTTPANLFDWVSAGTIATAYVLWGLFALVGVGIAFVIAGWVVDFIRHAIAARSRAGIERDMAAANETTYAQLENERILALGDRVGTIESME